MSDVSLAEKMTAVWLAYFAVSVGYALGWLPLWVLVAAGAVVLPLETWAYLRGKADE